MKPRPIHSFANAIRELMDVLGAKEMAHAAEVSLSSVYKWADPDHPWTPSGDQMVAIDALYLSRFGGAAPLGSFYMKRLDAVVGPEHKPLHPALRCMDITEAVGDLNKEVRTALHPNSAGGEEITASEAAAIRSKVVPISRHLDGLGRDVQPTFLRRAAE